MTADDQHLDLLAIFHYIVGALTALLSCFPLLHIALGLAMIFGSFGEPHPPPPFFGWIFVIVGGLFVLCGWALAVAMIVAGRKLHKRRSRTYCIVIGALECLLMPFGTVLGVFTIIMLMKESVTAKFQDDPARPSPGNHGAAPA